MEVPGKPVHENVVYRIGMVVNRDNHIHSRVLKEIGVEASREGLAVELLIIGSIPFVLR